MVIATTNATAQDIRFFTGQRFLLATGRLEFDPATGDFKATDWPFVYISDGKKTIRFTAWNDIDAVQLRKGIVDLRCIGKRYLGKPAIAQLRREQLSQLEKRFQANRGKRS